MGGREAYVGQRDLHHCPDPEVSPRSRVGPDGSSEESAPYCSDRTESVTGGGVRVPVVSLRLETVVSYEEGGTAQVDSGTEAENAAQVHGEGGSASLVSLPHNPSQDDCPDCCLSLATPTHTSPAPSTDHAQ